MDRSKNDVWVGLFVIIGFVAILFLALKSANLLNLSFESKYRVAAKFDNIGGLKPGAAVKSSGVVVGRVEEIAFDDKSFQARITLVTPSIVELPKGTLGPAERIVEGPRAQAVLDLLLPKDPARS